MTYPLRKFPPQKTIKESCKFFKLPKPVELEILDDVVDRIFTEYPVNDFEVIQHFVSREIRFFRNALLYITVFLEYGYNEKGSTNIDTLISGYGISITKN